MPDTVFLSNRIEVTRSIPAAPSDIFDILRSPAGHVAIDASGMLQEFTGEPAQKVGDTFVIHMDRESLNDVPLGQYDVTVRITAFERDKEIAWDLGPDSPFPHFYGYRLDTSKDGVTNVTSYYDWSKVSDVLKERFPIVPESALRATLGILERTVRREKAAGGTVSMTSTSARASFSAGSSRSRIKRNRAIVLGGGGPVGIAWEAGLLEGLTSAGVDLAAADTVIGTSAGAVVGCILSSGGDLAQVKALVGQTAQASEDAGRPDAAPDPALAAPGQALERLTAALAEAASDPGKADEVRVRLARWARDAETMSESRWLDQFRVFAGIDWPAGFCCTAVNTGDGSFRLWDGEAGVDLQSAVASSCALPAMVPPVTIAGHRWMDGGVRDWLNADTAAGHDLVLVVSCSLLEIPGGSPVTGLEPVLAASRRQIDELTRAGARVQIVVPGPEMLELSGWGLNMMDFTLGEPAYDAGRRQGQAEAAQLAPFWNGRSA